MCHSVSIIGPSQTTLSYVAQSLRHTALRHNSKPPCLCLLMQQDGICFVFGWHGHAKPEIFRLQDLLPARFEPEDLLGDEKHPLLLQQQHHDLSWSGQAQTVLQQRNGDPVFQQAASEALSAAQKVRCSCKLVPSRRCSVPSAGLAFTPRAVCSMSASLPRARNTVLPVQHLQCLGSQNIPKSVLQPLFGRSTCNCLCSHVTATCGRRLYKHHQHDHTQVDRRASYMIDIDVTAVSVTVLLSLHALPFSCGYHQQARDGISRGVHGERST